MSLGLRLKNARKNKGLSQDELANKCQIFQKEISNYESDTVVPNPITLKKLAEVLEVSIDYLLDMDIAIIKDTSLLKIARELDALPEKEKEAIKTLIKSLSAKKN